MIENTRSNLSFQSSKTQLLKSRINSSVMIEGLSTIGIAHSVSRTGVITSIFNKEYSQTMSTLNAKRLRYQAKVDEGLSSDPTYQKARNDGVSLAYEYEVADVKMGGNGSANWNAEQRQELIDYGRVRGAEGHHIKNVSDHPEHQADPDNIRFYKDKSSHLYEGHNGDFRNESDGDLIDKNKMLEKTNQKRLHLQELKGLGTAVAIGLGVGFSLSFISEIAKSGISMENIENALLKSSVNGIEAASLSGVNYGMGLIVNCGLKYIGIDLSSKLGALISSAAAGVLSIIVFSAYQYSKMRIKGIDADAAISEIRKQTAFSSSVLMVSIIAQGIYGGHAGIIVSTTVGLIYFAVSTTVEIKRRRIDSRIQEYAIEVYSPKLITTTVW